MKALLLTSWYFPLTIVRWEHAITLVYLGKADRIVDYDEEVRSPSTSMKLPAVLRLRRNMQRNKRQTLPPMTSPVVDFEQAPSEWREFLARTA